MSGYGNMQASPFWKGMMRVTGILCFVTLMIPPGYYFKYLLFDRSAEAKAATIQPAASGEPLSFQYVELYRARAEHGASVDDRSGAVAWLRALVLLPNAQVTHPVECLFAKATLGQVASRDPDAGVRDDASKAVVDLAANGAVIKR